MAKVVQSADSIAAKVAEILATSANEPGIHEMNRLMKMTESARQVEQATADMAIPTFATQTSNVQA